MAAAENPVNDKAAHLPEEAKEILKKLASEWEDVLDPNSLQVIPLRGAMTNEVFQIKWPTKTGEISRKVLVRIYGVGVDIFFDRDDEIRTFEFMSKHGQGPRLLGRFPNGRIEEFIHARTLSASDLRDPYISGLIAAKMKEFHNLDMPGPKEACLWNRLRNWLSAAKRVSSPEEVEAFSLHKIDDEISILERELSGAQQCILFCHNDLQYGNIMLDEQTNSVTIIDYEYASYNPVAYDIANHFCEMASNYHTETPHILDYSKYPDLEQRKKFVHAYLSSTGEQPSDSEVEHLLQEIEKYTLANHLFWGVWGIISGHVNKIDFDYKEYAKQRFQQYWERKPSLLGSVGPSLNSVTDNITDGGATNSKSVTDGGATDSKSVTDGGATDNKSVADGGATDSKSVADGCATDGKNVADGGATDSKNVTDGGATDNISVADGGATDGKTATDGGATDGKTATDGGATDVKTATDGGATDVKTATDGGATDDKTATDGGVTDITSATDGGTTDDKDATDGGVTDITSATGGGMTDGKSDGETLADKRTNSKNPGVFKKLKKFLSLGFFKPKN